MTIRPIASIGWRTVVSGGSVQFIRAESSKPTTETSSGTRSPARRTARIAPRAIGSLAQTMPVTPAREQPVRPTPGRPRASKRVGDAVRPEREARRRAASVRRAARACAATACGRAARAAGRSSCGRARSGGPSPAPSRPRRRTRRAGSRGPRCRALTRTVGQAALGEPAVVAVRRVGLGVEPAGEDHARDLLLEQEVDVVRLGHAADGLGAQDRREALLGEGARDDLGEGREDRVLELGQDEADEARALAAQLRRALVAQDVERGQDRLAGRLGDAGLLVEDAADRGLADADLAGDIRESSVMSPILRKIAQEIASLASV